MQKSSFSLICRVLASIVFQALRHTIFRCIVVMGTILISKISQCVILNIRSYHKAHFRNSIVKNIRGIPENTEKGLQAIPADSWPLHGVRGLQVSQLSP